MGDLRTALIDACRQMNALGINQGTSGNISLRDGDAMLISPSATPYDAMRPEQVARMRLDDADGVYEGPKRPSTEWRFHRDILRARADVHAVLHCHPVYCTALAMARRPIPAAHYMVAIFGGEDVRCGGYATFGTEALSRHALAALEGRSACLLANHGAIVCADTLERTLWLAVELETLARQYVACLAIGGPVLLSAEEIASTRASLAGYGRS